jgi:DedD protein
MAFFKFRAHGQKGDDQQASPAETIDDMRRRARHRLIGATVLVAIGVLGFPMLFDTQPRSVQVDIPIEIPDRDKAAPLGAGASGKVVAAAPQAEGTPPAAGTTAAPERVPAAASLDAKEAMVADKAAKADKVAEPAPAPAKARPEAKPEPKPEPKAVAKAEPEAKPEPKAVAKAEPEAKPPAATDDAKKARALLEGKDGAADAPGRFVVQVGAFADADKARETRMRLERAGLKTYTQVVDTKDGKRIRVRIGPYAERVEADKVAGRIKSLNLPASILAL